MRDLLVTLEHLAGGGARYVMSADALPDPGTAGPVKIGQKGKFFTFLIAGVPRNVSPEAVAKRIAEGFAARPDRPGHEWHVAYNVPWARLRDFGIEAAEPGIPLDGVAELVGIPRSTVNRAVSWGQLPVTRPWKPGGAQAPSQANPADVAVFREKFPPKPLGWPKGKPRKS
ncbi:MAG: hypothetical protein LBQ79_02565 [Deltaproteobacteria bacterium]|jgi:hypothetical protein|nr:hypothetical protein [Deltaproteobacteria bacterium]